MNSWTSLKQSQSDRLSCLPDQLLIHILSLLPTRCAIVVCVILHRRELIPWFTSLDFDASPICHCVSRSNQIERFPLFLNFVNSVLQAHKSPYLTHFRLNLGVRELCVVSPHYFDMGHDVDCVPDLVSTQINAWITFPLTRCGLRVLDLNIHLKGSPNQTRLSPQVFMIETLEVLKLDVNLSFDGISIFRLPILKTLHLHASIISEDAFLTSLVSSCPLLEKLKVRAWWNHVQFTKISSPSLRILSLSMLKLQEDDNSGLVVLDTPNLEDLVYLDNMALKYSITTMPRLIKATLYLDCPLVMETPVCSCQQLFILFRALSNVHHLSLDGVVSEVLDKIEENEQLPVFHDLILLELNMNSYRIERNTLLAFLYRSPNLKTLIFRGGLGGCPFDKYDEKRRLELEQEALKLILITIPYCCRFNLKRVLVCVYYGSEEEKLYIQFLLKYSVVLEELIVYTKDPTTHESTLQNLPRASSTCSIKVQHFPASGSY